MKQITIRSLRQPREENAENDIKWFCESLGLLGERDKEKTGLKIFKSILMAKDKGISADELSEKIKLSRTAVIHHVKMMMNSGLVIKERDVFELRTNNLQNIVDEIELDIERILKLIRDVAKDIDRKLMLPVRNRTE